MENIEKFNKKANVHAEALKELQLKIEDLFAFGSGNEYIKFYDCLEALANGNLTDKKFTDFAAMENAGMYWSKIKEVLIVAEYLKDGKNQRD